jgi:hypothetical protein
VLVLAFALLAPVHATYLLLPEGTVRCLSEDLTAFTLLRAVYSGSVVDGTEADAAHIGIHVEIRNPLKEKVYEALTNLVGEVRYTTKIAGDHQICFSTNTTHWWPAQNKVLRFEFDIRGGSEAQDMTNMPRKEHVQAIESAISRLSRRVSDVFVEYQYAKAREHRSRITSESTNGRVATFWMLGIVLAMGCGTWQVWYLRRFFAKKNVH